MQGDVVRLVDANGATVATYTYDAWGKVEVDPESSEIGNINPLRYRSYYFDSESGFYYLQSRYYDPAIGRFLNADVYVSTGQEEAFFIQMTAKLLRDHRRQTVDTK